MALLPSSIGAVIRRHRTASGLTQEELAHRAALHPTYISLVERARNNITLAALDRISTALGVSASALVAEAERERGKARSR